MDLISLKKLFLIIFFYLCKGLYICICYVDFVGDGVFCMLELEKLIDFKIIVIFSIEVFVLWIVVDIFKIKLIKVEYKWFGIYGVDWEVINL